MVVTNIILTSALASRYIWLAKMYDVNHGSQKESF